MKNRSFYLFLKKQKHRFLHHTGAFLVAASLLFGVASFLLLLFFNLIRQALTLSGDSAGASFFSSSEIVTALNIFIGGSLFLSALWLVFFLSASNILLLVLPPKPLYKTPARMVECMGLTIGALFQAVFLSLSDITFQPWNMQLMNFQKHSPLDPTTISAALLPVGMAILAYFLLSGLFVKRRPPLVSVFGIAGLYLGIGFCILWCIQIFDATKLSRSLILCIYPLNIIGIALRTIRYTVVETQHALKEREQCPPQSTLPNGSVPEAEIPRRKKWTKRLEKTLQNSETWPLWALLALLPILGVIVLILRLLGQEPDALLRVWTQTADWNLSQKTPPPNLIVDEHYLCTVAAHGHQPLVRPLRTGIRHDHIVLVNRQLQIANAFEEFLQEKAPRLHHAVRSFYDRYGYPFAKKLRSPWTFDAVYLLMKPAEWLFLFILYSCEESPENRITRQYPPAAMPDLR